jgi:hypothetical protein
MKNQRRDFIARGGEKAFRRPSEHKDVTLYGFAVKADGELVQEMLSRYITRPSENLGLRIDVRATSCAHVLFVFIDNHRRQTPLRPGDDFEGEHPEQLFAIVVPAFRVWPDPGLVLFAPYLYASDTPGWNADREIYGYPRQQADISIYRERPDELSVNASIIEKFGFEAMAEPGTVLVIERKPTTGGVPGGRGAIPLQQLLSALSANLVQPLYRRATAGVRMPRLGVTAADLAFFERRVSGPHHNQLNLDSTAPIDLAQLLMSGSVPMIFLKQFRDIAHPDRACYQAIVEARLTMEGASDGDILSEHTLVLPDVDSAPIARELGIPGRSDVDLGFRVTLSRMALDGGNVISNPDWNPSVEVSTADARSRLPLYVDRGGEAVWRQPSLLYGTRIYGFGVKVPSRRQQATLDKYINRVVDADTSSTYGSQPFHLRACDGVEIVMFMFVEYDRITSGNADDRRLGGSRYREFVVTQLAISDDPEFPELNWFIPYICLDSDPPRLGGREIFGYPKQLGHIDDFSMYEPGLRLGPARELMLTATVIRDAKRPAVRDGAIVRITGPQKAPSVFSYSQPQEMFFDLWRRSALGRAVDAVAPQIVLPWISPTALSSGVTPGPGVDVVTALLTSNIGDVFLKEFRDSANPSQVCHQSVCKTDTLPAKFHSGGRVDHEGYKIWVEDLASEPLLRDILGRTSPQMDASFAYILDIDLELSIGRVIANPLAADYSYSPDVSLKSTRPETGGRKRRVVRSAEPFWAR